MVRSGGPVAVLGALLVACAACGRPAAPVSAGKRSAVSLSDGVFPLAAVEQRLGSVPHRFAAELPVLRAGSGDWSDAPPRAFVRSRLCKGDGDMLARLERAARVSAQAGASGRELRAGFGELVRECGTPTLCAWALDRAAAPGAVREVAWSGLMRCRGPDVEALMRDAETPDEVVVEYWGRRLEGRAAPDVLQRLGAALEAAAATGDAGTVRQAAWTMARGGDRASAARLVALHAALPAGEARDQLASAFGALDVAGARAAFDELCARAGEREVACGGPAFALEPAPAPPSDCTALGAGPASPAATSPAGDETARATESCLRQMTQRDRVKAVFQARVLLTRGTSDARLGLLLRTLDRFPGAGELEAHLRVMGLSDPRGLTPAEQTSLTADEVLFDQGAVHCFDTEAGAGPDGHDGLLADLAAQGARLAAVVFEEVRPRAGSEAPVRLRAYSGRKILEAVAADRGERLDVEMVVALLNAVAVDLGEETRWVVLPAAGPIVSVIAGPREGLLRARDEGLLIFGAAGVPADGDATFHRTVLSGLGL